MDICQGKEQVGCEAHYAGEPLVLGGFGNVACAYPLCMSPVGLPSSQMLYGTWFHYGLNPTPHSFPRCCSYLTLHTFAISVKSFLAPSALSRRYKSSRSDVESINCTLLTDCSKPSTMSSITPYSTLSSSLLSSRARSSSSCSRVSLRTLASICTNRAHACGLSSIGLHLSSVSGLGLLCLKGF